MMKRYGFLAAVLAVNVLLLICCPPLGRTSLVFTGKNAVNFLLSLTPVFICIGLLDVWITRDAMIQIMGEKAGLRGVLVSYGLGVVTAVPLYALLPVAGMLLKKGCGIGNVMIFLCASASIRIPLLLFEIQSMGWRFTGVRFASNVLVVAVIAFAVERTLTSEDKERIYANLP